MMSDDAAKSAAAAAASAALGDADGGFAGAPPAPATALPITQAPVTPATTTVVQPVGEVVPAARLAAEAINSTSLAPTAAPVAPVAAARVAVAEAMPAAPAVAASPAATADAAAALALPAEPAPAPSVAPPASAAQAPAVPATPEPVVVAKPLPPQLFQRRVYSAGALRKTMLSFIFLLLLPFFGSLGPMAIQRFGAVPVPDMIGFVAMAVAFALLMLLILFELILSVRSRVVLDTSALRFTLPARGGIVPAFSYATHEIPYDQIDYVEVRREVYGGRLAPVLLKGARVVTKDGQKIPLGYVSEANEDAVIPFPEIAAELALRIGKPVVDRGAVRRTFRKKMMKIAASAEENAPLSDADIGALNKGHNRFVVALICCLLVLVGAGMVRDVMEVHADHGERAPTVTPVKGKG
jgi:hypothetical protein